MALQHSYLPRCLPIVGFAIQNLPHSYQLHHSMCEAAAELDPARALNGSSRVTGVAASRLGLATDVLCAAGEHHHRYRQQQQQQQQQLLQHRAVRVPSNTTSTTAAGWCSHHTHLCLQRAHRPTRWPQPWEGCSDQLRLALAKQCYLQQQQPACASAMMMDCTDKQQQLLQLQQRMGAGQYSASSRMCGISTPPHQQYRQHPLLLSSDKNPKLHKPLELLALPWLKQHQRCLHGRQSTTPPPPPPPPPQQQQQQNTVDTAVAGYRHLQAPGASWTSLPNLLSLSRVASGPWVAYLIATGQWPLALALTATAGITDWLDGYLARRLGHTSKLGSYLDPLADKVLVASVVGTMGALGMVPAWLAVLVVGRDVAQVTGMAWYRLNMFGGKWPGAAAFFDVDGTVLQQDGATAAAGASSEVGDVAGSRSRDVHKAEQAAGATKQAEVLGEGLPVIQPLLVSKINTALVFVLVAGCMTQQWQAVPGQDVLQVLEVAIAGTSAASGAAYGWLYWTGRLLPGPKR